MTSANWKRCGGGLAAGEYTDAGTLHGHTYLGSRRIGQAIAGIAGFPLASRNAVPHLLLSHHGTAAYGAPTPPAFAEAVVFSQCDLISTRAHVCRAARKEAAAGQSMVWRSLGDSNRVYVGPLGVADPESASGAPLSSWAEEELALPEIRLPAASHKQTKSRMSPDSFAVSGSVGASILRLPVKGSAAAGNAERSAEEAEEEIVVVAPPGGANFVVRVKGDSMIGAGIFERDLLLVRIQETAQDGEIVVAHIPGDGQVVKRLRYRATASGSVPELHSENPRYAPISVTDGTRIQGRIVGLHRLSGW